MHEVCGRPDSLVVSLLCTHRHKGGGDRNSRGPGTRSRDEMSASEVSC